jgi:hypothetical protein
MSIDGPTRAWESGDVTARASAYLGAIFHPGEIRWRRLFHIF